MFDLPACGHGTLLRAVGRSYVLARPPSFEQPVGWGGAEACDLTAKFVGIWFDNSCNTSDKSCDRCNGVECQCSVRMFRGAA